MGVEHFNVYISCSKYMHHGCGPRRKWGSGCAHLACAGQGSFVFTGGRSAQAREACQRELVVEVRGGRQRPVFGLFLSTDVRLMGSDKRSVRAISIGSLVLALHVGCRVGSVFCMFQQRMHVGPLVLAL